MWPAPGKHLLQTPGQCAVPGPRHTRHRRLTGSLSGTPTQAPGTCSHGLPQDVGPRARGTACARAPAKAAPRVSLLAAAHVWGGLHVPQPCAGERGSRGKAPAPRTGPPRPSTWARPHLRPGCPPGQRPEFPGYSALSFLPVPTGSHPTSEPWPCKQMQRLGQTGHSGHTQQPRSGPQSREWPAPVLETVRPAPTPHPTASPGGCNHTVAAPPGEARAGAQPGNSQASPQHSTVTRPPSLAGRAGHLQLGSPEGNLCLWPAAP